jgi:hypothetical protein
VSRHALRLLRVLPQWGQRSLRLAAYHAGLGDVAALVAAKELARAGYLEIDHVAIGGRITVTDEGRRVQLSEVA